MFDLISLWFGAIFRIFRTHHDLVVENLALRQQLAVWKRKHPRPKIEPFDKLFWILARRVWSRWKEMLFLVQPETVARWPQGRIQSVLSHALQSTKSSRRRSENFKGDS